MAIKILKGMHVNDVFLMTGRFYLFKYAAYQNDPEPLILFANIHGGMHDKTGHMHQYIQGINFHYLPVLHRPIVYRKGMKINENEAYAKKNFETFGASLQARIPGIKFSMRRYLLKPPGMIKGLMQMNNDTLLQYFDNPVQLVAKMHDTAEHVALARKMRAMGYYKKPRKRNK